MKSKNTQQDWLLLSAYLDGELPQKKLDKIQDRLESEPAFAEMHKQLVSAKMAMADMPALQSPRHFTLSRDMLPHSIFDRLGSRVSWNLASAIASAIFVLVVIADVFTFGLPVMGADQSAPEASIAMDAVEAQVAALDDAPEDMAARSADDSTVQGADTTTQDEAFVESAPTLLEKEQDIGLAGELESRAEAIDIRIFRYAEIILGALALIGVLLGRRRNRPHT